MKKVTLIVDGRKFNFVKDKDEETAESCGCCAFMGTGWCGAVNPWKDDGAESKGVSE